MVDALKPYTADLDAVAPQAVATLAPISSSLAETPANRAKIDAAKNLLDIDKPDNLIYWGSSEMERLSTLSAQLIAAVRSRDSGPIGDVLTEIVMKLKGFDLSDLKGAKKKNALWRKIVGMTYVPLAVAKERFSTLDQQIETIIADSDKHVDKMTRGIVALERLYQQTVLAYEGVKVYIQAGREMMRHMDEVDLPALKAKIVETDPLTAENYSRLNRYRERLERRVGDLTQTRQVLFNNMPTIAIMEDNNYNLISRIQSMIVNNVSLWKTNVALLMLNADADQAADGLKMAQDFGNDQMKMLGENLHSTSIKVSEQTERGLFDVDAIEATTKAVIATFEDKKAAFMAGRERRIEETKRLDQFEMDIVKTITDDRAKAA